MNHGPNKVHNSTPYMEYGGDNLSYQAKNEVVHVRWTMPKKEGHLSYHEVEIGGSFPRREYIYLEPMYIH